MKRQEQFAMKMQMSSPSIHNVNGIVQLPKNIREPSHIKHRQEDYHILVTVEVSDKLNDTKLGAE